MSTCVTLTLYGVNGVSPVKVWDVPSSPETIVKPTSSPARKSETVYTSLAPVYGASQPTVTLLWVTAVRRFCGPRGSGVQSAGAGAVRAVISVSGL